MKAKVVILGDGLSCEVFLYYLKYHTKIHDKCIILEKNAYKKDKRDDVPFYFNNIIDDFKSMFEPITISMGIYERGKIYTSGTLELSKKYSFKTIGYQCQNTISFIEREKNAYVLKNGKGNVGRKNLLFDELYKENQHHQYYYNSEVIKIDIFNKAIYTLDGKIIEYEYLLSTIPLYMFIKVSNQRCPIEIALEAYPFYIIRCNIISDNRYQVFYCTDENIRFSRMAKLNDTVYLESREKVELNSINEYEKKFVNLISKEDNLKDQDTYRVYPGRFSQIDEKTYLIIKEYYQNHNIFLLGRMATWRFKLIEDIYFDCEKICQWIR